MDLKIPTLCKKPGMPGIIPITNAMIATKFLHGWNPIPSNAVTTAPFLKADPKNGNDHSQESAINLREKLNGIGDHMPKYLFIWDLAYLVKSGMFSAKVAQEPMLAVREGKKSDQNCEDERVEGKESIGPKPPAFTYDQMKSQTTSATRIDVPSQETGWEKDEALMVLGRRMKIACPPIHVSIPYIPSTGHQCSKQRGNVGAANPEGRTRHHRKRYAVARAGVAGEN
nr:hypothetical protein Itr_chr04CG12640 [Ipomoea trifida]